MIKHAKKKAIENLDELLFLDSRAPTPAQLLKQGFGAVLLIVLSFKYTEYCFTSSWVGVRWQGSFLQRLKKSHVKEWKQSRSPVHNLGLTNIWPFPQLLPVWRLPAKAGSTQPGQEAQDKATTPERGNWEHSNKTDKAWVRVASGSDLTQAFGVVTA